MISWIASLSSMLIVVPFCPHGLHAVILAPNGACDERHPARSRGAGGTPGRARGERSNVRAQRGCPVDCVVRPPAAAATQSTIARPALSRRRRLNAGHQARRAAGAQRTLYAVACMPSLGVPLYRPRGFTWPLTAQPLQLLLGMHTYYLLTSCWFPLVASPGTSIKSTGCFEAAPGQSGHTFPDWCGG